MAYIYVKGNEYLPFDNLGDDLADIGCSLSSGFDVDTLLAYPIAVLNNKGYITSLSCEGHPLGEVYYETEEEHQKRMLSDNSDRKRVFDTRKNKDGINYVCIEGQPNKEAYIMFKEEIILPTSPAGWAYNQEDNSIRWNCDSYANPTDYYKQLISAIEEITLWAEKI